MCASMLEIWNHFMIYEMIKNTNICYTKRFVKLRHPTQTNLKYKKFQQFSPKNFFEVVHIFGSVFGPFM